MAPDLLFEGGIAHERWMNLFLGHIRSHFVAGRNVTWYVVFLGALVFYLAAVDRSRPAGRSAPTTRSTVEAGGPLPDR